MDGGMRIPRVPPAASEPRKSRSLYPRRSISGYATVPTVAAVATEEPEDAAKMAQEPMFACMSPPGSHDSHCTTALYMRRAMPARSMISPSRMNIGTATRMNSLLLSQVNSPMAGVRRPRKKSSSRTKLRTPSTAATGTAAMTSTSRTMRVRSAMAQAPSTTPRVSSSTSSATVGTPTMRFTAASSRWKYRTTA